MFRSCKCNPCVNICKGDLNSGFWVGQGTTSRSWCTICTSLHLESKWANSRNPGVPAYKRGKKLLWASTPGLGLAQSLPRPFFFGMWSVYLISLIHLQNFMEAYGAITGGVEEAKLDLKLELYLQSTLRYLNTRYNAIQDTMICNYH